MICDIAIEEPKWETALPAFEDTIRRACLSTLSATSFLQTAAHPEISVLLTHDSHIRTLNRDYLGKDKPTNVLSFPSEILKPGQYTHVPEGIILGDIALAYETIDREAQEQGKPFIDHFTHLIIHGLLHLLGYDHEKTQDATQMESLEIHILQQLGIKNPYPDTIAQHE